MMMNNYSTASLSVSSSCNIPVAMSQRGWKVNYDILLGSAAIRRVLSLVPIGVFGLGCSTRCTTVWSSAVQDSISAFACEGDQLLSSFKLNTASFLSSHGCKVTGRWSNEHPRSAQTGSRKLEVTVTDNTKTSLPVHCSCEQETDISSKLVVLDNFDDVITLDNKLGVLDQNIVNRFSKLRKFGFMLQISLHHTVAIMIICKDIK